MGGFTGLLAAVNINECALLLAVVFVRDAQRDAYVDAERLYAVRIIVRGGVRVPGGEGRIGRIVGHSRLMIGLESFDRLQRGLQVGTRGKPTSNC